MKLKDVKVSMIVTEVNETESSGNRAMPVRLKSVEIVRNVHSNRLFQLIRFIQKCYNNVMGRSEMISAKEAYSLSAPNLERYRAFIDKRIREAIGAGKSRVEIREDPYSMWLYVESMLFDKDAVRVIKELRDLGYDVSQYYSEAQFVDVALVISWDKS